MRALLFRFAASVEGIPPEAIALLLAVGLVLGTFPIYGFATILCVLASAVLRINVPALQAINQLASPLQFALFVPLARLGARFIGSPQGFHESVASRLGASAVQAIAGWFLVCVPLGVLAYFATT